MQKLLQQLQKYQEASYCSAQSTNDFGYWSQFIHGIRQLVRIQLVNVLEYVFYVLVRNPIVVLDALYYLFDFRLDEIVFGCFDFRFHNWITVTVTQ